MRHADQIRVIIFQDADAWVAQCLEYDIGAQAPDIDTLRERLLATMEAECRISEEVHGTALAGIGPAPQRYHAMWEHHSKLETIPRGGDHCAPLDLELALCA